MHWNKPLATFTLVFGLIAGQAATAATLYGYTRESQGELAPTTLNVIDPATGALSSSVGLTGIGQITAATTDPTTGAVYATHGGGGCCPVAAYAGCLLEGNLNSGAVSTVGCDAVYGGNDNMAGLAVDSAGNVYGTLLASNAGLADSRIHLVSVNKVSGALTVIGQTGDWCQGNGIEFGPGDILYFFDECQGFGTVNLGTGAFTPIGELYTGFPNGDTGFLPITDMAFDPMSGVMYASVGFGAADQNAPALATVDLATGEFTYVGDLPPHTNSLTFADAAEIPTIGTWGFVVMGLALLMLCAALVTLPKRATI